MKTKNKTIGKVIKAHVMEMQLHHKLDTRTFLLEYENYALEFDPSRIQLYSNQGNILVMGENRKIVVIIDNDEKEAA